MNNRSIIPALCALFLLTLAGCGGEAQSAAEVEKRVPEKSTNVTLATVAAGDIEESFILPGTLEAWEDLTLAAEMAGPVRRIGPEEGQRLEKGEAILRIDPETLEADLARNQAEYDRKEQHLRRRKKLVEKKLVSRQEYDDAVQGLKVAEANLRLSRVALDKSTLESPVDGVLDRLFVDRGEYVKKGDPVALVVQVDRLKVLVDVPEKDVGDLSVGDMVHVKAASIGGKEEGGLTGKIIHLAFKADASTRTYRAKIAVDNGEGRLRPGMIVKASFSRRRIENVISVPLYALVEKDGGKVAYVAEGGRARMREVTPGSVVGDRILIESGLIAGERLIVKGQQLVEDGSSVVEGEK